MVRRWRFVLVSALVMFAVSCGETSSPTEGEQKRGGESGVPANEVRVLGESARQSVTSFSFDASNNEGTIRFDASSAYAQRLEAGRIMASRPIEGKAPAGMLQRVKSVDKQGDEIVVTTRQATLAESFKRADIDVTRELKSGDVEKTQTLQPGVSFETRGQGLAKPFELNFDQVLIDADGDRDTTDDQLNLDGAVQFGASFRAEAKIKAFKLDHFLFAVDLEESVNLEVSGDFDGSDFKKTRKLSTHNLKTIVFQVGGVPVVIKIDLVIRIGIEGTITAELRASAQQSTAVRLGTEFNRGDGWKSLNEVDSSFNVPPPEFDLSSFDARGFAKPELQVTLYGVAGPYMFAKPFVRFNAKKYRSPYWKLSGGLEMGLGFVVKVPVLGEVADWEKSLPVFEEQIGTSSNRPPTLEVVSPEDGVSRKAGGALTLELKARDREQQELEVRVEQSGELVADKLVAAGEQVSVNVRDLCEGTQTLTITAEDDEGATDSTTLSAIVENAAPEVDMEIRKNPQGMFVGAFPGGYLPATANVSDARCSEAPLPDESRVAWYRDGQRIASGGDTTVRLAPNQYSVGETISLQAAFDDGQASGRSEKADVTLRTEPSGDLPIYAEITKCNICKGIGSETVSFTGTGESPYVPDKVTLRGYGLDPKQGELPSSALVWRVDGDKVGEGESASLNLHEFFGNPGIAEGTHTVSLTVEDGSGETVTVDEQFTITIPG